MHKGLEQAFDECLAHLRRGESLDACLQRYPQDRDELEGLLRLVLALQESHQSVTPAPQVASRGRAAFLGEAVQLQTQVDQTRSPAAWWAMLRRSAVPKALGTMALTLIFLLAALTGGNMVSANSLPGDALYGVKRASEQVRYLLTLDEANRTLLQETYAERRVQEIKQVLDAQRVTEVAFTGVVESMRGDTVTISGIAIQLAGDMIHNRPEIGAEVEIVAESQADGTLDARAVQVLVPAPPTPVPPTPTPLPATATAPAFVKPTQVPTEKPSETPEPSATATKAPTETPSATSTRTATLKVSPTATETLLPTATATHTPPPTATAPPPPREVIVRIEGRIDEIDSSYWTVNSQRVKLGSSTKIKQDAALAQVGGWAVVRAVKKTDGSLQAREIEVLRGPEAEPQAVEFSGVIESMGAEQWTISSKQITITDETIIEGTPVVGAQAQVKAWRYPDGRLVAERIIVVAAEEVVQFEGMIQSISEGLWQIAGQDVLVDHATEIQGEAVVGAIAEVEAVVRADGSKLARRIVIIWSPAAEPTLPATPVASPEALATNEPFDVTITPGPTTETPAAQDVQATPTDAPADLTATPEPGAEDAAFLSSTETSALSEVVPTLQPSVITKTK